MKVTVMARIREGKKYPFVEPVWLDTRLKPGVVLLKDADGKPVEVKRDDVTYYLRYSRHGKQVTEPAGKNPKDVLLFPERILATMEAEAHGLAVSGGNIIPMTNWALVGRPARAKSFMPWVMLARAALDLTSTCFAFAGLFAFVAFFLAFMVASLLGLGATIRVNY